MGRLAKFAAIVAALSVVWVHVTPAPDELPCTAGHKSFAIWAPVVGPMPASLQPLHPSQNLGARAVRFFALADILSLTCVFLC
jgi:hypothetical protein